MKEREEGEGLGKEKVVTEYLSEIIIWMGPDIFAVSAARKMNSPPETRLGARHADIGFW